MNKRGLSSVLVNILLILVVIAALSIVSVLLVAFIRTEVEGGEVKASLLNDGVTVSVKSLDDSAKKIELVFKRKGTSDSFSGVVVELVDINGKSDSFEVPLKLSQFETATEKIDFLGSGLDKLASLNVYPYGTTSFARQIVSNVPEFVSLISMTQSNVVLPSCTYDNDPCTTNGVYPDCNVPIVCDIGKVCSDGICISAPTQCGNGLKEGSEECDLGLNNGQSGYTCTSLCKRFTDEDYLMDVNVEIINDVNGKPYTFRITKDSQVLFKDYSTEKFIMNYYGSQPTSFSYTVNFEKKKGGVDIIYSVTSNSGATIPPPGFVVDGIILPDYTSADVLNVASYGANPLVFTNKPISPNNEYHFGGYNYPGVYSPIHVVSAGGISVGVSLQYPYLQDKTSYRLVEQFFNDGAAWSRPSAKDKSWKFYFDPAILATAPAGYLGGQSKFGLYPPLSFNPGETRNYVVSVRFADARNWIFTLGPYKKYLDSLYGISNVVDRSEIDRRPILEMIPAAVEYATPRCTQIGYTCNPRGYFPGSPKELNTYGLNPLVTYMLGQKNRGYQRSMIWAIGGVYSDVAINLNYPMHLTGFWLDAVKNSATTEFARFSGNMLLGFYWGNAGFIPDVDEWNYPTRHTMNYENLNDMTFLRKELTQAIAYGINELGLDAFPKDYTGYNWMKEIKTIAPSLKLFREDGGPDFQHKLSGNWQTQAVPSLVTWYLNPGSETAVYYTYKEDIPANRELIASAVKAGFTPITTGVNVNAVVNPGILPMYQCIDGIDNDGDGDVDMYDFGCADASDDSE